MRSKLFLPIIVAICALSGVSVFGQSYAITNAKIVTVSGAPIEKGTVVIRNGLIVSAGANVTPPADAVVIDASGSTVYPGFIDAYTNLGMPAAQQRGGRGSGGQQQQQTPESNSNYPDGLRPEDEAVNDLKAGESQFDAVRNAGITTVMTTGRDGIFNGQSVVVDLAGDSVSSMVVRSPFAETVTFTTIGGGQYPVSLLGTFSALRQMFLDAQRLKTIQDLYAANPRGMRRPESDRSLEALIPVVSGTMPIVFNANREREIIRALDLIKEFKLKGIIAGGQEAWKVANRFKAGNVPIMLSLNFPHRTTASSPEADPETLETLRFRAETPKGASILVNAGVNVVFQSGGAANPADLFVNAGKAVEAGLSRDAAIRAMTLGAAELFGISAQTGSIDAGKIANVVVVKGDVFSKDRYVSHVFVDGKYFEQKEQPKRETPGRGTGVPAGAPNIGGNYTITIDIPGEPLGGTLALSHQGATLTGTMTTVYGTTQIRDGKVTANNFSFNGTVDYQGTTINISVQGTVTGDAVSGTIDSPQGAIQFAGKKTP